jgi:deazaflavin-dependent oxidoreductase (nitroreductase family)
MGWPISDDAARAMYAGGRANATARRLSRFWVAALAVGLLPRRGATLEVPGRRSGRPTRFPLVTVEVDGHWYLVSMLGEDCNWVRNVRAAGGRVTLRRRGRRTACRLVDVPVGRRPAILRRYLAAAPGARPHIPVDRHAPTAAFTAVAAAYPVFQVVADEAGS